MPDGQQLSLNAARRLPQLQREGRHPDLSTVWRWATRGCRGVVLETWLIGGRRVTTAEAVARFINALSTGQKDATVLTPTQRSQEIEQCRRRLAASGLCSI
jgi:hypothetical protein